MHSRFWKIAALSAVVLVAGVACAPPPTLNEPLVVTTNADTFDGVCDLTDCSLRDAVAASNALAPAAGIPNRITVPAGAYTLSPSTPIEILKPLIITGANAELTMLDVTGSTIAAPSGVFDAKVAFVLNGIGVISTDSPAADVLVTCEGHEPRPVSLFNVSTTGLLATSASCNATLVSTAVSGPATVLTPFAFSASSSTLPFPSTTITPVRFSLVSSTITGPSATDGSTQNATIDIQAPDGAVNIPVDIAGSRLVGVGLQLGGTNPGKVTTNALSSSFGMTGPDGPLSFTVGTGSIAKLVNSTVYAGGPAGALRIDGSLIAESLTATTSGPAIATSAGGTTTVRRSVLSSASGATCTAPITSLGYNIVVGSSCGTAAATDVPVANEAALALGTLDRWGNPAPSLHRLPLVGSPLLDVIPPGLSTDPDCPTDASGGRSIDARGILRPQGTGCDIGALEVEVAPPPAG